MELFVCYVLVSVVVVVDRCLRAQDSFCSFFAAALIDCWLGGSCWFFGRVTALS